MQSKKPKPKITEDFDYRIHRDVLPSLSLADLKTIKRVYDGNVKKNELSKAQVKLFKSMNLIHLDPKHDFKYWRITKEDNKRRTLFSIDNIAMVNDLIIEYEGRAIAQRMKEKRDKKLGR